MPITNFEPQKPKLTYLSVTGRANCYKQCQSTPIRINFHLLVCALKIQKLHSTLEPWFFFHGCEVALTSHICFPIRLVFHQHLNSHIAYPDIPPEPSNHTRGQFLHLPSYPLLRLLWSKSDNKVTKKRILDQYHTGTSLSSTALR